MSAHEDPLAAEAAELAVDALVADARARGVPRFEHGSRVPGWDQAVDLSKDPAEIPSADEVEVPGELRSTIEAHMAKYPDRHSASLPALEAAQRLYGWCSPEAIEQVATVMRVTPAYLESVATFYDMLETAPVGRHAIYVCTNITCSLLGADALYDAISELADAEPEEFNVRSFECLGACDIAPMASVDGVYIGPLEPGDAPRLLEDARAGREVLPDKQLARRPAADPRANSRDFPRPPAIRSAGGGPAGSGLPPAQSTSIDDDPTEPASPREGGEQ